MTDHFVNGGIYRARCIDVTDVDTVRLDIFVKPSRKTLVGFGIEHRSSAITLRNWKARFCDINGLESGTELGDEGTKYLEDMILGKMIMAETHKVYDVYDKQGKYGRWVVKVFYKGRYVNQDLVDMGYAVPADYG